MTKTALVCGAGGFIGSHLVKRLKRDGFWVRGVDLKFPEFTETEADDFVISATRGHAMDATIVQRTAETGAGYVGMLGSKRKMAVIRKALEQSGVKREALDRIKCPIGENIGADTPAEIAVSVVAELIKLRRMGDERQETRDKRRVASPSPVSRLPSPCHQSSNPSESSRSSTISRAKWSTR